MATTFDYYVRPAQRADGSHQVQIRITHNRKNKYITTSIYVMRNDLSRDGRRIKNPLILENVDSRLRAYREAFLKTSFPEHLTIDQLLSLMDDIMNGSEKDRFRLDIFEYLEKVIKPMEPKTAEGYRTAFNAIRRFAGDHIDINDITASWVMRFKDFLETEPPVVKNGLEYRRKSRGSRAVSYYLGCLRHVHNVARMEFNDDDTGKILIPRHPFAKTGVVPKMPITDHRTLIIQQIQLIMSAWVKPGSRAELARDMFVLTFALAGTNTVDIYKLKALDLRGELLTYRRSKTKNQRRDHAEITLKVLPEAMEIIEKYRGLGDMLLNLSERYSNSHEFNRAVNKGLKKLAEDLGIEEKLQTYHARHSWGTIARNVCGVDFDTVNAGLNHARTGNDRIADIYIARDYTAIWAAQEKVMAEVKKPIISENSTIISENTSKIAKIG